MAITNKLITFNKLTSFETQLAQGNILETSIVFIKDAKKIWTKGTYFDCSGGGSNNIAIYETTDAIYSGELTFTQELLDLITNERIHNIIIISSIGVKAFFPFHRESYSANRSQFDCIVSKIWYSIIVEPVSGTYQLLRRDLALKSDIPNTDDFATKDDIGYTTEFSVADIEAVYGRGVTKPINVQGLMSAIETNKLIIIPTNITDASQVGGNAVTMAKMENDGFIYLNVIVPYLDGVHKEYFIQIKITTAQLIKSGSNGSITLKELVAKTDLKTINGESILGSGDITISGGGSSSGSAAYPEVNHGTSDTTFTLTPNTFHVWDEVSSLTLTLGSERSGVANEYLFQFTSGATATTLILPDDIKWANDSPPTIAENMIYQVSILKGLASVLEFSNAPDLIENIGIYNEGSFSSGATLTFQYPVESDLTIYFYYASSDSFTLSKGNTTLNIDWNEPSPPQITGFSPAIDNVYKYIIQ